MSFGSSPHQKVERYLGIQVQTSIKGKGIPVGWGTFKVACNLIDYLDFTSEKAKSAGKGGGGGATTYNYTATILMAVCIGPIAGIRKVWKDSDVYTGTGALGTVGLNLANGSAGQSPWSYLSLYHADRAIGYSGTAYVFAKNYSLNSSATPPNHNFEVQSNTRAVINNKVQDDAWPHDIATSFFSSIQRWPAGLLSMASWQTWNIANGFLLSPVVDSQTQASSVLQELLDATASDCVFSDGLLKFIPYGDSQVSGNNTTWTPNNTPSFDLYYSDFMHSDGEEAIKWEETDENTRYNIGSIEFYDRSSNYSSDVVTYTDTDSVALRGKCRKDQQTLHSICLRDVADKVVKLMVQRSANTVWTCTFKLPMTYIALEPLEDKLTVPFKDGSRKLVRITEYTENPDEGSISYKAEEMNVGISSAGTYTRQTSTGTVTDRNVDAGNTAIPTLFNIPLNLSNSSGLEVWFPVCSANGNPKWGGCEVWLSTDGNQYYQHSTITGASRYGSLTAALPAGSDPDTTNTISVDLTNCQGQLDSGSQQDADTGTTICYVDGEYISYQTATLTGSYKYTLGTYLRRGMWGSAISSHAAGTKFIRLDDDVVKISYNVQDVGRTIYVKLLSQNVYGKTTQTLDDVTAVGYMIGGPPTEYACSNLQASTQPKGISLSWDVPDIAGLQYVEVWRSTSASFSDAGKIATLSASTKTYQDTNVTGGANYWYWARLIDIAGSPSQFYPAIPGAGVQGTAGRIATADIADDAVTKEKLEKAIRDELAQIAAAQAALDASAKRVADQIDAANQLLTQAALLAADAQQTGAMQYQAKIDKISAATDTAAASITDVSKTAATATAAVANRTTTIETQLSGMATTTGSVNSAIQNAATAYVDPLNALSATTQSLQSLVGGQSSQALFKTYTSSGTSGASASTLGTLTATDGTHTATVGYQADAVVENGVVVNQWRFIGDRVLFSPPGQSATSTMDVKNGRITFNNGAFMLVEGVGFGAANQFCMWFGPTQAAIAGCTESNGVFWLKTDGSCYFGGSLSAGKLKNANQSTSIAADAYVETGSFASNGGTIVVTLSFTYSDTQTIQYPSTQDGLNNFMSRANQLGLTLRDDGLYRGTFRDGNTYVDLYRSLNAGAYVLVNSLQASGGGTITGMAPVVGDSPGGIIYRENVYGSLTYTDPDKITQNRQYKAQLRSRSVSYTNNPTQTISIVCLE